MSNLQEEIGQLLGDLEAGHSRYQLERFVVGSAGDRWAQLKQSKRELHSRWQGARKAWFELELLRLDVEVKKCELAEGGSLDSIYQRRVSLELRSLELDLSEGERGMAEQLREFAEILRITRALQAEFGDISDERRALLEERSWARHVRMMVGRDLQFTGRVGPESCRMLSSLPAVDREQITELLQTEDGAQELVAEASVPDLELPSVSGPLPLDEARRAVECR